MWSFSRYVKKERHDGLNVGKKEKNVWDSYDLHTSYFCYDIAGSESVGIVQQACFIAAVRRS